ncbi:GumC family protein [Dyadobacter luticola]|uniref:non-specific protein-tyrosine kinase n=1 Tax=Dyadobacter luticola TaxID=1979387 RepID=A0A5R9L1F8_9BACT|nr:polysaccharide biosynthesis tyrosine autokinase [Dyadobacter luticola]TLV02392.1 polysaccharide biosynthesis tyrosine autokinase [Dyadobacter luticola]
MNKRHEDIDDDYFRPERSKFDLKGYLLRYLRYWYLFPIFVALSLIAAFLYLQITKPVYLSQTSILIKDEKKGIDAGASILEEMTQFGGDKLVENEIEIFKAESLMGQVAKELNLEVAFFAKDGLRTVDLYKNSPIVVKPEIISEYALENSMYIQMIDSLHYKINDEEQVYKFGQRFRNPWGLFTVEAGTASEYKDIEVRFFNLPTLTASMLTRLTVSLANMKSTVLQLTFEDPSKQRGKDILNKLLDVYVQSSLNDKNSEASNTLKFIETRLGLITGELGDVEQDVEAYKTSKGLTDISAESQLFLQNIKENDSKLSEINTQISILESVDNYIKNSTDGATAPATYMINDPVLVSLLTKYNDLILQREKYARTTQANNPLLETINTQLAQTKQAIRENVQNLRRGMDVTKRNLEGINTRFSAGLRSIPQKEREYVGIKRQQTIKEGLYLYLLQKREETALGYASTVTDSRLIDAPTTSIEPIKPKKLFIWSGALLAGFAIPVLLINLIFLLNNTIQSKDDIEKISGISVLGEIGTLKVDPGQDAIISITSRSAVAEQFRALRTNLQYLGDGRCRVLMFTSSIGGEGKSFVSVNLAASLAYSDKRVILVGLDLRKPTLHERLNIPNSKGVTNYLIGHGDVSSLIQSTGVHPKFDVITSGPIPPNPSELLGNGRLPILIKELREEYDYILIDSPPYGLVTDASIISDYVDASLYLVRFNYTLLDHITRIAELNRTKRFANLSVIFNGVNYGTGYGYGYGYGGYGYGYYSEDEKPKRKGVGEKIKKLVGMS